MPQKKAKKAPKAKKKVRSTEEDEETEEVRSEDPDDADEEEVVEREPGIEEIAKMAVVVEELTDDDLDDIDLPTAFEPSENEN